ncbi:MAG: hypothetical protein HYU41_27030, partial [Candidatus Rokubacteria bacterium]|nr:hypothetical protein [Candidatus Rokubacteria bacterium]
MTPAPAERVVYYAAGGGHGHVLRGLAVLHALGTGTLVGPRRLASWAAALGVDYVAADPHEIANVTALRNAALLLVDVFPRGVVGELAQDTCAAPRWLVTRRVTPAYYLDPRVRETIETGFEQIVWCEEPPAELMTLRVPRHRVPPVLLCPPVLDRDAARRRLGVTNDRRLILALGTGDPGRQGHLARLLGKIAARADADLRFVSDDLPAGGPVLRLFPAAAYLRAADVVVAAGGYHAVHETQAVGVPTIYIPQARRYDDQWWRVRNLPVATDPATLERMVRDLLAASLGNGSERAVEERHGFTGSRRTLGGGGGHLGAP